MTSLEEIRKRKLAELQAQNQQELQEELQLQQQIQQLEGIVKGVMTKEAIQRYGTLKMAHPEKAIQALVILAQSVQQGQIKSLNDDQFKEILKKLTPAKKQFKMTRR